MTHGVVRVRVGLQAAVYMPARLCVRLRQGHKRSNPSTIQRIRM